ncbi:MAG: ABC transporter substrate-binding protein [Erysipelotrichaceae bacterium]|nr:ABC transporter substrate-binding protein [Erysipelotrichaceae bacterium]
MKKILLCLLVILLLAGCSKADTAEETVKDKLTIGIITWVTHPALDDAVDGMMEQVKAEITDREVEFILKNANEDASTAQLIVKDFVSEGVDLIYAVATPSVTAAYAATLESKTPIIFAAVTDAVAAGVVTSNELPGTNVSGVSDAAPLQTQLNLIQEILPDVQSIGMLYNLSEINGKLQVDQATELAAAMGITVVSKGISADNEIALAAQQLASSTDALYIITDNKIVSSIATVINQANSAGIPVFAAENGQMDAGLLASDSLSYFNMGKEAGSMIVQVLIDGVDITTLPVKTEGATQLYVNQSVADSLGITLPDSVIERAEFVD